MARNKHKNKNRYVPAKIDANLQNVIKDLPEEKQKEIISSVQIYHSNYQGPIPPPEMMKAFNDIVPGSAERILKMAETRQNHRNKCEMNIIVGQNILAIAGLLMAFLLIPTMLYAAYKFAESGSDKIAGTIVTMTVSICIIFVLRKSPISKSKN